MLNRRDFNKLVPTGLLTAFLDFDSLFGNSTVRDELISVGITTTYNMPAIFGIGQIELEFAVEPEPIVELELIFKTKRLVYLVENKTYEEVQEYPLDIRTYQCMPNKGQMIKNSAYYRYWKLTEDAFYLILEVNDRKIICKLDGLKLINIK